MARQAPEKAARALRRGCLLSLVSRTGILRITYIAVTFETLSKSRTYLVCDRDVLLTEGHLCIFGFFAVTLKVLDLQDARRSD